jgi:hypothetical protein
MKLMDCVAQCRTPLVVRDRTGSKATALNGAADCAAPVARCPLRYVLCDDLTRMCADLAYSRGAGTVACADLLHVPAETLWMEWSSAPWKSALQQYGFRLIPAGEHWVGRRGAWVRATRDGRRGLVRAFWSLGGDEALASSVEGYFDFDTAMGEEPEPVDGRPGAAGEVFDHERSEDDILGRCFRFRYEESWSDYYASAGLSSERRLALWRHALGTIAVAVPMLLAFLLLLATRTGLPQRPQMLERLNLRRGVHGKAPLLDHIEVHAPLLPEYGGYRSGEPRGTRRSPRLHLVRGHLVRRGGQIFWRVPHLRGSARSGAVRTRTVIWTFDRTRAGTATIPGCASAPAQ